jgi:hypothetical protein
MSKINIMLEGDVVSKIIDLKKSVHDLCKEDPKILGIMKSLGFENIAMPGMLKTVGKLMTIQKGAQMKGISMEIVKAAFMAEGFEVVD